MSCWIEESPLYKEVLKLWLSYYYKCEAYDRQVCSGYDTKRDCAMPATGVEYSLIIQHSRIQMSHLREKLLKLSADREISRKAQDEASKYSHNRIGELLSELR